MELTGSRPTIQVEETQTLGAVSESLAQRLGGGLNLALKEVEQMSWFVQGSATIMSTPPLYGIDGPRICLRNMEVVAFAIWALNTGVGGSFTFDCLKYSVSPTAPAAGTSIFTTAPIYTAHASIQKFNTMWLYDLTGAGATLVNPNGAAINTPALDGTASLLNANEWLLWKITSLPTGFCSDFQFTLFTRPR